MSANGIETVVIGATVIGSDEGGTMMTGHPDVKGIAISLMIEAVAVVGAAVETGTEATEAANERGARALLQRRGSLLQI